MCLATPVRIEAMVGPDAARVTLEGAPREVSLALIESPQVGDYVLMHSGYAVEKLHPDEAQEILAAIAAAVIAP